MESEHDFLKYWRIVRYWAKAKYEIGTADLDLILFLYSEKLFSEKDIARYESLMSWNMYRFPTLLKDGDIIIWRKGKTKTKNLYALSHRSKRMVISIYKKLLLLESISVDYRKNPIFDDLIYNNNDKRYRRAIKDFNERVNNKELKT